MKKKASSDRDAKGRKAQHVENRTERRFEPKRSRLALATMIGTAVGGLALGAGVYAQWLSPIHWTFAPWLVAAGAIVLAAVILWGDLTGPAIRVGDAGIAVEKDASSLSRFAWCDITRIDISAGRLVIESRFATASVRVAENPQAAAWIVREAGARIPKTLTVADPDMATLPASSETEGAMVAVEATQVTGRRCKASDKVITFERDARLCARCGEIYHAESLPERCLTCDAALEPDES